MPRISEAAMGPRLLGLLLLAGWVTSLPEIVKLGKGSVVVVVRPVSRGAV